MCFDNANGIQVIVYAESFRTQYSNVVFVLLVSRCSRFGFGKDSLKGSSGILGAPSEVPVASLGGSEASLGVHVSAADDFVMYGFIFSSLT